MRNQCRDCRYRLDTNLLSHVKGSKDALAWIDPAGRIVACHAGLSELLGRCPYHSDRRTFTTWVAPSDQGSFARFHDRALQGETPTGLRVDLAVDGEDDCSVLLSTIPTDMSRPGYLLRMLQDPPPSRTSVIRQREAVDSKRIRYAVEAAGDRAWELDLEHRRLWFDQATPGAVPLPRLREEEAFRDWLRWVHPDDRRRLGASMARYVRGARQTFREVFRLLDVEEQWRWVRARGRVCELQANGHPRLIRGLLGTVEDAAGQAMDATGECRVGIRASQVPRGETLVDNLPGHILFVVGPDQEIKFVSRNAKQVLGTEAEALLGHARQLITDAVANDEAWRALETALRGRTSDHVRFRYRGPDGVERLLDGVMTPIFATTGEVVGVEGVAEDVGEREAKRVAELTTTRLRTQGCIADGIAHHYNNAMAPIMGYLDLALADPALGADTRRRLETARQAGWDVVGLTHRLQESNSALGFAPRRQNLAETLRERLAEWRQRAQGYQVDWTIDLDEPGEADLDADLLTGAVWQLLLNAFQAASISGDKRVSLRLERTRDPAGATAPHLLIEVRDQGPGIPAADLPYVALPFFCRKGEHAPEGSPFHKIKGAGLGLTLADHAIRRHGGSLVLLSVPGQGVTARITLPCQAEAPTSFQPAGTRRAPEGARPSRLC